MKRLLLVFNPRSSHYAQVRLDVLDRLRSLKGWMVGKYEIVDTDVDDNAERLSKLVMDGDLVVAAGGDGTANIAMNGALLSGAKNLRFAVMGYGNFNDMSHMFGDTSLDEILEMEEQGKYADFWPLECKINGEHWRYAMCYLTVGMFAESCAVFDKPKVRKKLQKQGKSKKREHKKRRNLIKSLWILANWWLKNKKRCFLPCFSLGDSSDDCVKCECCSDYMAVNSPRVAKIMRGGDFYRDENDFLSFTGQMTKFTKLVPMMFASVFKQIPGMKSDYDCLVLSRPAKIMLQAEGEYKAIDRVQMIELEKTQAPLCVIAKEELGKNDRKKKK